MVAGKGDIDEAWQDTIATLEVEDRSVNRGIV